MASQGPYAPSTVGGGASPDGAAAWVNPNNAAAGDGSFATFTDYGGMSGVRSGNLTAENFGFTLPSGATVTDVSVAVTAKAHYTSDSSFTVDAEILSVTLLKPNGTASVNKANNDLIDKTVDTYNFYDAGDPLWGLSLSRTEVNDSLFRVSVQVRINEDNDITVFIDSITVTVEYTTGGGGPVTGELSVTLGAITATAQGYTGRRGDVFTDTPGYISCAALGERYPWGLLYDVVCSSVATVTISATTTSTLASVMLSTSGRIGIYGEGICNVHSILLSTAGYSDLLATLIATVNAIETNGLATLPIKGQLSASLGSVGCFGRNQSGNQASVSVTLAAVTADSSGFLYKRGDTSVTLGEVTLESYFMEELSGYLDDTLLDVTLRAGEIEEILAQSDSTIDRIISQIHGSFYTAPTGVLELSLEEIAFDVNGGRYVGAMIQSLPSVALSANAMLPITGSLLL